jgi:hypothetical protein
MLCRQTILLALLLAAAPVTAAPKAPVQTAKPDMVLQIKLRDLVGLIPAKDTPKEFTEILQRLRAIEEQLKLIETVLIRLTLPPAPPPTPPEAPQ